MQERFLVHTREGEPCPVAATARSSADRRRRPLHLLLPELPGETAPQTSETAPAGRGAPASGRVRRPVRRSPLISWPGSTVKTEAIVLRSIRYGEADRILHLYSPTRGRFGAIAKGARKPKSRFGGRLEPFFRLDLILHEGRSDLMTVTSVVDHRRLPAAALRRRRRSTAGARACDAVLRLLDSAEPNLPAYNLLCRYLALLDEPGQPRGDQPRSGALLPAQAGPGGRASPPSSPPAPSCGEAEHLAGFSGAAGGVVCASCEAGSFGLSEEAHRFMVEALAKPLIEAPGGRAARPAPGRAGGRRDPRAPRARPTARRGLRGALRDGPL